MTAKRVTPGMRQRRELVVDLAAAAALAALLLSLAAGLGVVAVFAVPVLVLGLAWVGLERLIRYMVRVDRRTGSAETPKP
jgi:hypothetical protein